MTDIVDDLREFQAWCDDPSYPHRAKANLFSGAADEIERLTACLKWEQNWLERVGTHAPGCWQWGPGHYLCAVRHIEEMERG